jgi:hypothetical protein
VQPDAEQKATPGVPQRRAALARLVMIIPQRVLSLALAHAPRAVSKRPRPDLLPMSPLVEASDKRIKAERIAASVEDYRQRQNNLGLVVLLTVGSLGIAFAVVVILASN